jgi:hypothetical protein
VIGCTGKRADARLGMRPYSGQSHQSDGCHHCAIEPADFVSGEKPPRRKRSRVHVDRFMEGHQGLNSLTVGFLHFPRPFQKRYASAQRCINGAGRMKPCGCAERLGPHPGNRAALMAPYGPLPRKCSFVYSFIYRFRISWSEFHDYP